FTASAAVFGGILPALFSPSVNKTRTWLFERLSLSRLEADAMADPIAVPSSTRPIFTRSKFCKSQSWSNVIGLTTYGRPANAMMPMRSFGRASMNFRVTSRIASTRVASWPPMVKSLVSIEPETSRTSMMSIPLASICVRLLPSCGRARATTKKAMARSKSARRILPTRAALCFPIARRLAVDEYVSAAAGPRLPRNHASNGIPSNKSSSHGRAKVNALLSGNQLNGGKLASFHEADRLFQQQFAVRCCRFVLGELNEIAPVQKIFEQRLVIAGKRRGFCRCSEKLYGSLSCCRDAVLLGHVTPQNIGHTNAELIGVHFLNFAPNLSEFFESNFAWRSWRQFWFPSLRKPPPNKTEQ